MIKNTFLLTCVLGLLGSLYANAKTEYTGDIINGHKVITKLDLDDIPPSSFSKMWLQMPRQVNGQAYHVPLIVAKGAKDGKKLLLNTGMHGDELNGLRVVQRVLNDIDISKLQGSVVGVTGANVNGMYESARGFLNKADTGLYVNLNRQLPGNSTKGNFGARYAAKLWEGIYGVNNFDVAVDFHTSTSTMTFPNFVYADLTIPYVYRMTELTGADLVKIDLGATAPGSVEVTFDQKGIPAITYELGKPKLWQKDQIQRAYDYSFRQMADLGMYPPNKDPVVVATYEKQKMNTYYGNEFQFTSAKVGGFVEIYVKEMDIVKKDQIVGTMFNVFGDKVQDFYPIFDGLVAQLGTNPLKAPGDGVVNIMHNSTDPKCINGC